MSSGRVALTEGYRTYLPRIARGTALVYGGAIAAMVAAFVGKAIAARFVSPEEFGFFVSIVALLGFAVGTCELGLQEGLARYVAFFRGRGEGDRVVGVIRTSLAVGLGMSVVTMIVLLLASGAIGRGFLHVEQVSLGVWVIWLVVPFYVVADLLAGIFQGYEWLGAKVFFIDTLRNALFPLLLLAGLWPVTSASGLIWSYGASGAVAGIAIAFFAWQRRLWVGPATGGITRELLSYSLPIFISGIFGLIVNSGNTLILGYLISQEAVAYYAIAFPLVALIPLGLVSIEYAFLPVLTEMYAQGLMAKMRRLYPTMVRWGVLAGVPVAFPMLLAPEAVLSLAFGPKYVGGAATLSILAIGMLLHTGTALSDIGLRVIGSARWILWTRGAGMVVNTGLALLLTPRWGVEGMAAAYGLGILVRNLLSSVKLYQHSGLHPLGRRYWATLGLGVGAPLALRFLFEDLEPSLANLGLSWFVSMSIFIVLLLGTKSVAPEDKEVLGRVRKRLLALAYGGTGERHGQ